jgi:hypothetical protein
LCAVDAGQQALRVTGEKPHASGEALLDLGDETRLADPRLAVMDTSAPFPLSRPPRASLSTATSSFASDKRRSRVCGTLRTDSRHEEGGDRLALSVQLEIP